MRRSIKNIKGNGAQCKAIQILCYLILSFLMMPTNAFASDEKPITKELEFKTIEEVNIGISNQLNFLITYNTNTKNTKKWYVYVVGEARFNINLMSGYVEDQLDLSDIGTGNTPIDITELNAKLVAVNNKLKAANKPVIYYGIANKKKAIAAPFFPFENTFKASTASTTALADYYKKAFSNPERIATSEASEKTYNTLKAFFEKDGEAQQSRNNLVRQTLAKAGDLGAVALARYYFAIIKGKKGQDTGSAKVSWWSFSNYLKSNSVEDIDKDALKAHYGNLSSTSGNKSYRRINAWFNYLSGAELPESQFLKEVLRGMVNNKCTNLSTTNAQTQKETFNTAVNSENAEKIITATRNLCSDVLRTVPYATIVKALRTISKTTIKDSGEAVVLYLLHNINNTDYTALFTDFKKDNNALLRRLLSEMDDRSIYPMDGDYYTSFIGALLYIGNQNQGEYLKKERVYILETLLMAREDFEWDQNPIAKAIASVLSFNIDTNDTNFETYLTQNDNKNLLKLLQFLTWDGVAHNQQNLKDIGDALGVFFAANTNQKIYIDLLEIALGNKRIDYYGDPRRLSRIAELVFRMFGNVPDKSTDIYAYLTGGTPMRLKALIEKTSEKDYEEYADVFYDGLTKILDAEQDINVRIELAKWAIDNDSGFNRAHENLVVNIFNNIDDRDDRQIIYNFLTYKDGVLGNGEKNYDYFNKITAEGVLSGYDKQVDFIEYYVDLILEGFGNVNDRVSIIKHAVNEGDDWSWFWYSDTEDVISSMFNNLTPGEAETIVKELGKENYKLFKAIWEILQNVNWWAAIDRDNERLSNFAINISRVLELSKEQIGWEKSEYENYLDSSYEKGYLSEEPSKIKKIESNYLPMCRANFFGYTDGQNTYALDASVDSKRSKPIGITLKIGDKTILDKSFNPFEYIFVEFVEDTKINGMASFKKGDIIAVPAFYVAWMSGTIGAQQASVAARVTMDGVVIVLSAIAIAGSGGALTPAVMAAGAEIFFAGTDVALAVYKDELDAALGSDFTNTLEIANMAWGLINLPVALKNLPQGLVKIRKGAGSFYNLGKGMTFSTIEKLSGIKVDIGAFVKALPKILNELKNNPAARAQLFKKVSDLESNLRTKLAGLSNPSKEFKKIVEASKALAVQFYTAKAPFVGGLVKHFPDKLQTKIVNKLLILKFEGKTFCKIDPEGFLKNIDLYAKADNYKPISGLEVPIAVKVEVKGKVYDEFIVIVKDYKGSPIFRPQFEDGFVRSSDLINELHIRSANSPPYMAGTEVTDFTIKTGDPFFVVEYKGQSVPGGFGSNEPITTIEELRKKLAVLEDWKNPATDEILIRKYEALQNIQTRSGLIGPQLEASGVNAGQMYPGGGHQYEFLENWRATSPDDHMRLVGTSKLLANSVDDLFQRSIISNLTSRGLSSSVIDDVIIHARYIDDAIGNNQMLKIIDDLTQSPKFKNHDDLLENLKSVFSGDNVNTRSAKDLLNELEEGKYWINQGEEVYISKKWSKNTDEVDVTITTKGSLVECKNVTGSNASAFKDRLNDIISKFTNESKLSSSIKNQYPNHYGKINISNSSNPYYNLNKTEFINKVKLELLDQVGGINKNNLINSISELHVETAQGRFLIKSTDW